MTKVSYKDADKKKAVRQFLFSHYKKSKIVGLAGPDINDYIKWCKDNGFEVDEVWERDPRVMMRQLTDLKHDLNFKYRFGDIDNTDPNKENTVYDLDYCGSMKTLFKSVMKFKKTAVITFSLRGYGTEKTLKDFFRSRKEKVIHQTTKMKPMKHIVITTTEGKYIATPYFDTTPMLSVAKIS